MQTVDGLRHKEKSDEKIIIIKDKSCKKLDELLLGWLVCDTSGKLKVPYVSKLLRMSHNLSRQVHVQDYLDKKKGVPCAIGNFGIGKLCTEVVIQYPF